VQDPVTEDDVESVVRPRNLEGRALADVLVGQAPRGQAGSHALDRLPGEVQT
jgi:hypothetical protein